MKNSLFLTIIIAAFLALTTVHAQNFGSEVCKIGDCRQLMLLGSRCGYVLDRATSLTAAEAYCTCNAGNFTSIIKPCLECMKPYNIPIYTQSTWERLCPNAKQLLEDDDDDNSGAPSGTNGRMLSIISGLVVAVGIGFMGMIV